MLHVGLEGNYWQLNGGYTYDSEGQNAFHLVGGPRLAVTDYFRLGCVIGPYFRQSHYPLVPHLLK